MKALVLDFTRMMVYEEEQSEVETRIRESGIIATVGSLPPPPDDDDSDSE